jgi:hypothetical protein
LFASTELLEASAVLQQLHEVGYAHRNLGPGSILLLAWKKLQTALVDYGDATAKIGPLSQHLLMHADVL